MAQPSPLAIECTIEIDRSIETVRRAFLDLDHTVRDRVNRAVALRWLPPTEPGERRLEQTVRVMGVRYTDEMVVTVRDDGAMVKTVVAGPGHGTRHVYVFERIEDTKTRVRATVTVPATGFRWAVGPLLKHAVGTSLRNELDAHRRDLEGGYVPGRARGNLASALSLLDDVIDRARAAPYDAERIALMAPLVEAACAAAIADHEVDDAEHEAIREVIAALGVASLDRDAVEAIIASSVDQTRHDGLEHRCDQIGARLRELGLGRAGVTVATVVAQISQGVDQSELAVLQRLAGAAGMEPDALTPLLEEIDRRLSSVEGP